jgi:hypothetical protein
MDILIQAVLQTGQTAIQCLFLAIISAFLLRMVLDVKA